MKKKKKITSSKRLSVLKGYASTLTEIQRHVEQAQTKATISVNKELVVLYWTIGEIIVQRQQEYGWGSNVIEKLAQDLQNLFPGITGFSRANVFRMRAFYLAYEKVSVAPRQLQSIPIFNIPWWHNVILLTRLKDIKQQVWYAQKAIDYGWSGVALESAIKSNLYKREGKAITNFSHALPSPHSAMVQQALKDPYIFDFLTLHDEHVERDLEHGLIQNVQKLLLEMGKGFALVARQYHLSVSGKDYYIDLLFYHVLLKCYVVVELKAREFDARDAGQLNFYLSAVDDLVRSTDDKPTIGLLLCKTKDNFTAEYALRNIHSPIGVAEYQTEIMTKLPKELKKSLPSVQELEAEFEKNELLVEQSEKEAKKSRKKKK